MTIRGSDLVVLSLVVLCAGCSALKVDLVDLLKNKHRQEDWQNAPQKRKQDGNPCPEPEKPFPCKSTGECIPMGYVCDDNIDCADGYDEDGDVCTAAHRPPVEDILHFLQSAKGWIVPKLFSGKNIVKIAHGLAVSRSVDDFKRRMGLSSSSVRALKKGLEAVKHGREEDLEALGMPPSAWSEVNFIFSKLVNSGFA